MSQENLLENLKKIQFSRPGDKQKLLNTTPPEDPPDYQRFNEIQLKRRGGSALFVICGVENYRALRTFRGDLRRYTAVVAEPDLSRLRHLLENEDLTGLVDKNNILFICGEAARKLGDEVEAYFSVAAVDDIFTVSPMKNRKNEFQKSLANLKKFKKTARTNQATMEKFLTDWYQYFAQNLDDYIFAEPLHKLEDSLRDGQCTIVGPGADLDDHDQLLAEAAGGWLVALDTTLPLLVKKNITPDFVISVDTGPENMKFFENFPSETTLVTPPYMHPDIINKADEVLFFEPNFPPAGWLKPEVPSPGFLALSGSVATTALDFVRHLNPASCLLLGVDLCFKNHLPYSRQSPQYLKLTAGLDRFSSLPGKIMDILVRYELNTETANGEEILTTARFLSWREGLEFLIDNCSFSVYRPRDRIIPLEGTLPVEEMAREFNKKPLQTNKKSLPEIDKEGLRDKLAELVAGLSTCASELQVISKMKKHDRQIAARWLEFVRSMGQKEQLVRYFQWEVDRLTREMQNIDRQEQSETFIRQLERWQKLIPTTLEAGRDLLDNLDDDS